MVALVDAPSSMLLAQYEYGPFAEPIRATGPLAAANPFRFSTTYHDAETDLLYYGYRYYSPTLGRWLSRDPSEERGGANLNGFLPNDLSDFVDGDGRKAIPGRIPVDLYQPADLNKECDCTPPACIVAQASDAGSRAPQFRMKIRFLTKSGCYKDVQIRWETCWRPGGPGMGLVCGLLPSCDDQTECAFTSGGYNTHVVGIYLDWLSCEPVAKTESGKACLRWVHNYAKLGLYCRIEPRTWPFPRRWICD